MLDEQKTDLYNHTLLGVSTFCNVPIQQAERERGEHPSLVNNSLARDTSVINTPLEMNLWD